MDDAKEGQPRSEGAREGCRSDSAVQTPAPPPIGPPPLKSETKQLCKRGGASTPAMGTKLSSFAIGVGALRQARRVLGRSVEGGARGYPRERERRGAEGSGSRREAEIPHRRSCLLCVARKEGTFESKHMRVNHGSVLNWLVIQENSH